MSREPARFVPPLEPVVPAADQAPTRTRFEAEYELESPARCVSCENILSYVGVVRLMRTSVNFTSSLPHRGFVIACPHCHSILPAALYEVPT